MASTRWSHYMLHWKIHLQYKHFQTIPNILSWRSSNQIDFLIKVERRQDKCHLWRHLIFGFRRSADVGLLISQNVQNSKNAKRYATSYIRHASNLIVREKTILATWSLKTICNLKYVTRCFDQMDFLRPFGLGVYSIFVSIPGVELIPKIRTLCISGILPIISIRNIPQLTTIYMGL